MSEQVVGTTAVFEASRILQAAKDKGTTETIEAERAKFVLLQAQKPGGVASGKIVVLSAGDAARQALSPSKSWETSSETKARLIKEASKK